MLQIPILVSVRQVVPLFPNLVDFPKIGDNNNNDVTAKSDFIFGFLDEKSIKMPSCNLTSELLRIISTLQFVNYIGTCIGEMSFWPQ